MADPKEPTLSEFTLSKLYETQVQFKGLIESIESSLADLADPEKTKGIERIIATQEAATAELVEALTLTMRATEMGKLTEAIRDLKLAMAAPKAQDGKSADVVVNVPQIKPPAVNVQVNPTPITVEAVMPQQQAPIVNVHVPPVEQDKKMKKWRVKLAGIGSSPPREMVIEQEA